MRSSTLLAAPTLLLSVAACSPGGTDATTGTGSSSGSGGASSSTSSSGASSSSSSTSSSGASSSSSSTSSSGTSSSSSGAGGGAPTAAQLLALVKSCSQLSNGLYKTDADPGIQPTIPICKLNGAVFWSADMDVDCDGKTTAECNSNTDPAYQNQTSATDSNGDPLDAATLPYVVIPLPSSRFDYTANGLSFGSVVAVLYGGQLQYGVFGDEGPSDIIGEASYAMAKSLGIDPNPATGGVDTGVTYIAFTGPTGVVGKVEDHALAIQVGQTRAAELVAAN